MEDPSFLEPQPESSPRFSRRKAVACTLTVSALAGGGLATAWLRSGRGDETVRRLLAKIRDRTSALPRPGAVSWQPGPLENEAEYTSHLAAVSLRYIRPAEVLVSHRKIRGGVPNEIPPRLLWENLHETLRVADEVRHRLGQPLLRITSAYRSPAYNLACAGASRSFHMENRALDLVFEGGPESAASVARALRDEGYFTGGIGLYANFIHVDTRGRNADWTG